MKNDWGDGEDGEDGGDVCSNDFSRSPLLFVVTTSVVTALLGVSQVTPSAIARPPVPILFVVTTSVVTAFLG